VSTIQILLVAAIGVSLVVSFVMKMPSASRRDARKLLASASWLDEESADGSPVKIMGVVRMREHGERFVSPISETRCVVLRVRVLVRHGRDPRAKLVEKLEIKPFLVEDGDGDKHLVDATHVLLDIAPVKLSNKINPRKNQLLMELGFANANSMQSEFEETLVELGVRVTVAGTLQKVPDPRIVGTEDRPIAVRLERISDVAREP
jgi:hypothetical protein